MRPIRQRTDQTFSQALKCVGFRLPRREGFKPEAYELALALRYGLVGVAAAHHLLVWCPDEDEEALTGYLRRYGELVEESVEGEFALRDRWAADPLFPMRMGQLAKEPVLAHLPLFRRLCPLELCLSLVADDFCVHHKPEICAGSRWLGKTRKMRAFQTVADQSYAFALYFFERRQADLDEVKEIALLGE